MQELVEIICDSQQEAQFAGQVCKQKGFQNIMIKETARVNVMEVEGTHPNYVFSGKYSRMAQQLWIVSAEK